MLAAQSQLVAIGKQLWSVLSRVESVDTMNIVWMVATR